MNERGMTILESLIAMAVGSIFLLGINSFYVATIRMSTQDSSQTFLQRQSVLAIEEMARQIRPATALTRGSCNADVNSLGVTNGGNFCFYRRAIDPAHPETGFQLFEDRPGGGTMNLLAGSLAGTLEALTVSSFESSLSGTVATVTLQLQDNAQNFMTFTTTLGRRNRTRNR